MKKNLTFSEGDTNRLTREKPMRRLLLGIGIALLFSPFISAFFETLVVSAALLLFRLFIGTPPYSFLLWAGEILSLGGAAAILADSAGELFPSFFPFYWGVFFFLALSLVFFGTRFLVPVFCLATILALTITGIPAWIGLSLFAGAVGGIYPLPGKEAKIVTFM